MVRATTLKKNAKARAASMNSDKDDAIVATIILPPGHERILEDLKKVMTDSIMLDRRPDSEGPKKKEKAVNPFNIVLLLIPMQQLLLTVFMKAILRMLRLCGIWN